MQVAKGGGGHRHAFLQEEAGEGWAESRQEQASTLGRQQPASAQSTAVRTVATAHPLPALSIRGNCPPPSCPLHQGQLPTPLLPFPLSVTAAHPSPTLPISLKPQLPGCPPVSLAPTSAQLPTLSLQPPPPAPLRVRGTVPRYA